MIKLKSLLFENILDNPNFKKWFGNSKVVDSSGNPLVVHHGTKSKFTTFKQMPTTVTTMFGSEPVKRTGFFFSDKTNADSFGSHTIDVYLKIENPADLIKEFDKISDQLVNKLGWNERYLINTEIWEMFDGDSGEEFVKALKSLGYDGVIFTEPSVKGRSGGLSYVAFDPHQIKSATDNNGEFSTSSSDITKEYNI